MIDLHLPDCGVIFNEDTHEYIYNGRKLSGITGIIKQYICPDKYKDVPKYVLDRAAAKGTDVHRNCELCASGFAPAAPDEDTLAFIKATDGVQWAAVEYLVTDRVNYASAIDLISADDILWDIKHTRELDLEYLSWQLSIYAVFYEAQTGRKVKELRAAHVRDGNCKVVVIERQKDDDVKALLEAAAVGGMWLKPAVDSLADLTDARALKAEIEKLETTINEMKKQLSELVKPVFSKMAETGQSKFENNGLKLSIKAASIRTGLDTKRLKVEQPSIFEKYQIRTPVAASYSIELI